MSYTIFRFQINKVTFSCFHKILRSSQQQNATKLQKILKWRWPPYSSLMLPRPGLTTISRIRLKKIFSGIRWHARHIAWAIIGKFIWNIKSMDLKALHKPKCTLWLSTGAQKGWKYFKCLQFVLGRWPIAAALSEVLGLVPVSVKASDAIAILDGSRSLILRPIHDPPSPFALRAIDGHLLTNLFGLLYGVIYDEVV